MERSKKFEGSKIMNLKLLKSLGALCKEQLPTILSGAAVIGVFATGICAAKASLKAKEEIEKLENPTTFDKVKVAAPIYGPSIAVGGVTVACILGANRISVERYAALAGTCAIAKSQLQEHKDKVLEMFGKEKAAAVEQEIAKDQVVKKVTGGLICASDELVTCKDLVTGMTFKSSMVRIQAAANLVNRLVLMDGSASLIDFYDEIGEDHTPLMEKVRWYCDSRVPTMDVEFGAEISEHGLPYLTFTYECG